MALDNIRQCKIPLGDIKYNYTIQSNTMMTSVHLIWLSSRLAVHAVIDKPNAHKRFRHVNASNTRKGAIMDTAIVILRASGMPCTCIMLIMYTAGSNSDTAGQLQTLLKYRYKYSVYNPWAYSNDKQLGHNSPWCMSLTWRGWSHRPPPPRGLIQQPAKHDSSHTARPSYCNMNLPHGMQWPNTRQHAPQKALMRPHTQCNTNVEVPHTNLSTGMQTHHHTKYFHLASKHAHWVPHARLVDLQLNVHWCWLGRVGMPQM